MNEAQFLGQWLGILFYVLGGAYLVISLVQKLRPQPSNDARYVSRSNCDLSMGNLAHRIKALESRDGVHEQKMSENISKVHERVDRLTESLANLTGVLKTFMDEMRRRDKYVTRSS